MEANNCRIWHEMGQVEVGTKSLKTTRRRGLVRGKYVQGGNQGRPKQRGKDSNGVNHGQGGWVTPRVRQMAIGDKRARRRRKRRSEKIKGGNHLTKRTSRNRVQGPALPSGEALKEEEHTWVHGGRETGSTKKHMCNRNLFWK